jgi:hypothetical protein
VSGTRGWFVALGAAGLLAAVGCGGDDVDLTGIYRVDSAVGSMPCGTDMPLAMPPAYVELAKQTFFGVEFFALQECRDAAATDCSGGGLFADSFAEPIDGGWRGVVSAAFSGGSADPMCTLRYSVGTALLAGATLTVESTEYSEQVANTAELCTSDEAGRRGTMMACIAHEQLVATRL